MSAKDPAAEAVTPSEPSRPTPDEALEWLKATGASPRLTMTWTVAKSDDPSTMDAILDILFRPQPQSPAA